MMRAWVAASNCNPYSYIDWHMPSVCVCTYVRTTSALCIQNDHCTTAVSHKVYKGILLAAMTPSTQKRNGIRVLCPRDSTASHGLKHMSSVRHEIAIVSHLPRQAGNAICLQASHESSHRRVPGNHTEFCQSDSRGVKQGPFLVLVPRTSQKESRMDTRTRTPR